MLPTSCSTKDLGITMADGVVEGSTNVRQHNEVCALLATSSNFGNMFSAAGACVFRFFTDASWAVLLSNLYDIDQDYNRDKCR